MHTAAAAHDECVADGLDVLTEELADVSLFKDLPQAQIARLAPLFFRTGFADGQVIFAQGDRAETAFVLEDGEVSLCLTPEDGGRLTIATVRPGEVFGWSAVLGRSRYTSSAICQVPAQAIGIRGDQLRAVIHADHELAGLLGRMAGTVANRLHDAHQQIAQLIHHELRHTNP